jgi:hypothetical protein
MERTKTFVNGGRLYPADINVIEDRAAEMLEGTFAAIPSSHFAGRYYRATDTKKLYVDDGIIWVEVYSGANTITDGAIVSGRALVETGNNYGALTSRVAGTEYEPSPTRMVFVVLENQFAKGVEYLYSVSVGGVVILERAGTTGATIEYLTQTFLCPPAKKWKITTSGGGGGTIRSSYLIL